MKLINEVLHGTPIWVFALFGYLVWAGIAGLTQNVRKVSRVWITPAIFIAWGVIGLVMRSGPLEAKLIHWFIAALAGTGIGLLLRVPLEGAPQKKLVVQPGSAVTLLPNVGVFGAHYVLHVLPAMKPHMGYMPWDIYVSGASAGYFAGWAIRFARDYRRAMRQDSNAAVRVLSGA